MRRARTPTTSLVDPIRQFLEAEIELALTFLATARNEYRYGDMAGGDLAKRKAVRACAEVERRLDNAEARGTEVRGLRARLGRLHTALACFDEHEGTAK